MLNVCALTLISWISIYIYYKYIHYKVWDEMMYLFPNFSDETNEVEGMDG